MESAIPGKQKGLSDSIILIPTFLILLLMLASYKLLQLQALGLPLSQEEKKLWKVISFYPIRKTSLSRTPGDLEDM